MHNLFFYFKSFFIGVLVGKDKYGNTYYVHKKNKKKRWVIYKGLPEATKVPPEWFGWLHGITDTIGEMSDKRHYPNLTGTDFAHTPKDTTLSAKHHADYQRWEP